MDIVLTFLIVVAVVFCIVGFVIGRKVQSTKKAVIIITIIAVLSPFIAAVGGVFTFVLMPVAFVLLMIGYGIAKIVKNAKENE